MLGILSSQKEMNSQFTPPVTLDIAEKSSVIAQRTALLRTKQAAISGDSAIGDKMNLGYYLDMNVGRSTPPGASVRGSLIFSTGDNQRGAIAWQSKIISE